MNNDAIVAKGVEVHNMTTNIGKCALKIIKQKKINFWEQMLMTDWN